MYKVLITGGSGFIGTNLLLFLIEKYEILNIDIRESNLTELRKYTSIVDITNYENFRNVVIGFSPDYIIHLAARTDLNGKFIYDYSANTVGVSNLMKIIHELPKLKKLIVTSSMLVCHTGYYPKNQFDYAPNTLYGESKVETEKIVWDNKPQCDWAIIRPTSIWGPWFGVPYRNFFDMVISRKYFHIGRKSCTKTYGYVGNAVYQIEQILFHETLNEDQKVFYIGDNPPTNIEIWANEIAAELNFDIKRVPFWMLKIAAYFGDLLKLFNITFPMTSFRLKNMTTDNTIDLSETYKIAPNPPCSRIDGIKATLQWLKK
ncbi:MAG: NAD-dependent epimerase/dehydratase family protein [Bacteroides cellulosilyticus]